MIAVPPGLNLIRVEALPDPSAVVVDVEVDGQRLSLIVTRRGGRVAAFRNRCAHANYPLQRADGRILLQEGRFIVCGAHGASYRVEDGACTGGPCNGHGLERVSVRVSEGYVVTT